MLCYQMQLEDAIEILRIDKSDISEILEGDI